MMRAIGRNSGSPESLQDEAYAMVSKPWKNRGSKRAAGLLYIVPRPLGNKMLPLSIEAAPAPKRWAYLWVGENGHARQQKKEVEKAFGEQDPAT